MLEQRAPSRITTSALANQVGVSEAALYKHFPSKTRMFEGLLDYFEEICFSRIHQIKEQKLPVSESCMQILELILVFVEKNPGIGRLFSGDSLSGEDPKLGQRVRQIFDRVETELRQILTSAELEQGVRANLPKGQAVKFMLCLVEGRIAQYLRSGFRDDPVAQFRAQWNLTEKGLGL